MAGTRREARERVLELLYEAEMKGASAGDVVRALPMRPDEWVESYVTSVDDGSVELDARIAAHLRSDWELERLAVIDRLVLRMGVWELEHGDAPAAVVLAEAVAMAKRYGGEQSAKFVNGVLAAVAKERGS